MAQILQNAIKIIDSNKVIYLKSSYQNDFRVHYFKDCKTMISVDGGHNELKRVGDMEAENQQWEEFSLYKDSDFTSEIVPKLLWGVLQRDLGIFRYVPLITLPSNHLRAILDQEKISGTYFEAVIKYLLSSGEFKHINRASLLLT